MFQRSRTFRISSFHIFPSDVVGCAILPGGGHDRWKPRRTCTEGTGVHSKPPSHVGDRKHSELGTNLNIDYIFISMTQGITQEIESQRWPVKFIMIVIIKMAIYIQRDPGIEVLPKAYMQVTRQTRIPSRAYQHSRSPPFGRYKQTSRRAREASQPRHHTANPDTTSITSLLPTRNLIRPITRLWKVGATILIPAKLLRANRPRTPPIRRILHTMVNDPVLASIRRRRKRRMTNTVRLLARVLVEDGVRMLAPVARVHGVVANELELTETVVAVV